MAQVSIRILREKIEANVNFMERNVYTHQELLEPPFFLELSTGNIDKEIISREEIKKRIMIIENKVGNQNYGIIICQAPLFFDKVQLHTRYLPASPYRLKCGIGVDTMSRILHKKYYQNKKSSDEVLDYFLR